MGRIARSIAIKGEFAYDCETSGFGWLTDKLLCISIFVDDRAFLINFAHPLLPVFTPSQVKNYLGQYFEQDCYKKYTFNGKFDRHFLESAGIPHGYIHFDGYVASWFIDTDLLGRGLKALSERYLGIKSKTYDGYFSGKLWTAVDPKVSAYYACKDAELHFRLCKFFEQELDKFPPQKKIFEQLEMPVLNMDYKVESEGFDIDLSYLSATQVEIEHKLSGLLVEMKILGLPDSVDPGSPKQLSEYLFDTLGLPQILGKSTGDPVLKALKDHHPIIPILRKFRKISKINDAYIVALQEQAINGKIYPTIKTLGTQTGRTTMENPSLQVLPAKQNDANEDGTMIRRAFIAKDGYMLASKDLKGQELRIMAHRCGPGYFQEVAVKGTIYEETASVFYKVPSTELKKGDPRRDNGKIAWLGLQYGAGPGKIAEVFGSDFFTAKKFIDDLFKKRFPEIGAFQKYIVEFSKENNYVESLIGRRRHLHYDKAENSEQKAALEREAQNVIQIDAADQLKLAFLMLNLYFESKNLKTRAVLRIHDEIIFRIWREEWTPELDKVVDYIMTNALPMSVEFETTSEFYECDANGISRWGVKEAA